MKGKNTEINIHYKTQRNTLRWCASGPCSFSEGLNRLTVLMAAERLCQCFALARCSVAVSRRMPAGLVFASLMCGSVFPVLTCEMDQRQWSHGSGVNLSRRAQCGDSLKARYCHCLQKLELDIKTLLQMESSDSHTSFVMSHSFCVAQATATFYAIGTNTKAGS